MDSRLFSNSLDYICSGDSIPRRSIQVSRISFVSVIRLINDACLQASSSAMILFSR